MQQLDEQNWQAENAELKRKNNNCAEREYIIIIIIIMYIDNK